MADPAALRPPTSRIERIIGPSVGDLGYDLVRVLLTKGGRRTLQIMIERRDQGEITVDDCVLVSRTVAALLDVEDPIRGAYELEVSSPGLDRPLVHPGDFARFSGFEAKIELLQPLAGRTRLRGRLRGVEGEETIMVDLNGEGLAVPYANVKKAKLVLTDELIAANRARPSSPDKGAAGNQAADNEARPEDGTD